MLIREFEELAGRTVTAKQYEAIEALYMESKLSKEDFVKSIKKLLKSIPEKHEYPVLVMACHTSSGEFKTPNGCYYMTERVELVDVDIRTGKRTVRVIPNTFDFAYSYDITDWDNNLKIEKGE